MLQFNGARMNSAYLFHAVRLARQQQSELICRNAQGSTEHDWQDRPGPGFGTYVK